MLLKTQKDLSVYFLLEKQANLATRSAEKFLEMVDNFEEIDVYAEALSDLEHEGDNLTHELQNKIASTFITPLDKEDLKELSQALDDVADYIEAAAARAQLYKLKSVRKELKDLSLLLVEVTKLTEKAVHSLRKGFGRAHELRETLKEIHTVENASDKTFRTALGNLFDEPGIDALTVIKWKEMFDRIETAVDKCEDIAAIIGTILVKYA
jgi:predicted phosphate transport protein (TIGR00153 family)